MSTASSAAPGGASAPLPGFVIASLGHLELPLEIDRYGGAPHGATPARPSGAVEFRFCFHEVPFRGRTARRDGRPVLTLTGDLGHLPFTIESARRRRRLRRVLLAAQQASGIGWHLTPEQRIEVTGTIDLGVELGLPLTPIAVVTGAATLLLACRPYLDLMVAVAGEA